MPFCCGRVPKLDAEATMIWDMGYRIRAGTEGEGRRETEGREPESSSESRDVGGGGRACSG